MTNRIVSVMQPYIFPYLGYFQLIFLSDHFVIYDDVGFIKQGWINANRILVNGQPCRFTIPLKNISSFRTISETMLDPDLYPRWREKFYRTLKMHYGKSEFFSQAFQCITAVLDREASTIDALARDSIREVTAYLGIPLRMTDSSSSYQNGHLHGQERIIDICLRENAAGYLNLPGGRSLYDHESFCQKGLTLRFIQPSFPEYQQPGISSFVPGLSIIDLMMHNSVADITRMLSASVVP